MVYQSLICRFLNKTKIATNSAHLFSYTNSTKKSTDERKNETQKLFFPVKIRDFSVHQATKIGVLNFFFFEIFKYMHSFLYRGKFNKKNSL